MLEVILTVGPWLRGVTHVVPSVTINGYRNTDSDDDNAQGWFIDSLTWDAISGTGNHKDEERIRLKFNVHVRGESSQITHLGYFVFARARHMGKDGIDH